MNLSVPAIGSEFNASAAMVGWIVNGYILAAAVLAVPFGRFADMTGRKRILVTGIFTFAICAGGAAFATSMGMLVLLRIIQGIGAAMIFCTNTAVLISVCSPDTRGRALVVSVASTYRLISRTGSWRITNHNLGWRSIFIMTFIVSITAFIVA